MRLQQEPLKMTEETTYALDKLEHSNQPLFITGKAGTGKSTLLRLYRKICKKRLAIVAPTGVAALNVQGQTIHSFFKFPPRLINPTDLKKARNNKLYKNLEVLVIDEISMVRADILDLMDYHLRLNRGIPEPFGGVRVIFFGDMFQLPPVVATNFERFYLQNHYRSPYFFSSYAYQSLTDIEIIELNQIYRQKDPYFIRLLNALRENHLDEDDLQELNTRICTLENRTPGSIVLTTLNRIQQSINEKELNRLDTPQHVYHAKVQGRFPPSIYPTDIALKLKKGAQIMTIRNDPQRRYVNGSLGIVTKLSEDTIVVKLHEQDDEIEIEKELWESYEYKWNPNKANIESKANGSFEQWPLKLAWAMTIHKSQGKSFDKVYIDMGRGAFEYGQTYVALSRCRTLQGLQFRRPLAMRDIMVDEKIIDFYRRCHY